MTHTSDIGYIGGYRAPTKLFRGGREAVNISIRSELVYCPQCRKQVYLKKVMTRNSNEVLACSQCRLFYRSIEWKRYMSAHTKLRV